MPPSELRPDIDDQHYNYERMAKKDFRRFLAFMAVVLSALGFAVLGNV